MIELMITPDSHPLTYAAVEKAMTNGYFVAAHRRDGYVAVQITDDKYWRSSAFKSHDIDGVVAADIRLYTEKGWHRKLAS